MDERKHIHLVDDDEAIRHSASFMLRNAGFTVKTYVDGVDFLDSVSSATRGCILLDIRMPVLDGIDVLKALGERGIDMPTVVLTGHGDVSVAVEAMKVGAADFIEKPYEKQVLLGAIEAAFNRLEDAELGTARAQQAQAQLNKLTARERDVLERLVEGLTNKGIAEDLAISARTVEIHRANLMAKLGADSLSAALKIAFAAGIGMTDD